MVRYGQVFGVPAVRQSNGDEIGTETWTVEWLDDPSDGTGSSDPDPHDLKKVTEEVRWKMASDADVIRLSRLFAVH